MFIARQPIFNNSLKVYGYELLHRDKENSICFSSKCPEMATAQVLGGLFETGLNSIVDDSRAFVNFNYNFLLSESIELINPEKLIIEVLEDVEVDDILMERLLALKDKGYKIALDDFIKNYYDYPIVSIADIIKYDIIATPLDSIELEVKAAIREGKIVLAEKIETEEEYESAKAMGFHLFQGYFFKKPSIIGKSNKEKSIKLNYIRILNEVKKAEPSYDKLAEIIKSDVNLAYRLFRIIKNNKSEDALASTKTALLYMGFLEIERWINILILQDLATDKPIELMRLSLIRSKFGEELALNSNLKSRFNETSTMFLFSTLDALLDKTMEKALDDISVTEDTKSALIEGKGELAPLLKLVYAYENANWNDVKSIATEIEIEENKIYDGYIKALEYCKEITDKL